MFGVQATCTNVRTSQPVDVSKCYWHDCALSYYDRVQLTGAKGKSAFLSSVCEFYPDCTTSYQCAPVLLPAAVVQKLCTCTHRTCKMVSFLILMAVRSITGSRLSQ